MIQNIWSNFSLVRYLKGGHWVLTRERGWLTLECYEDYLSLAFDPGFIKEEVFS